MSKKKTAEADGDIWPTVSLIIDLDKHIHFLYNIGGILNIFSILYLI